MRHGGCCYEQGYDDTTVEEIIRASGTSKGTFYHYFKGKDALLTSLSELFDNKYEELIQEMPEEMGNFEKLLYLNQELFGMIETSVSRELLASMYSSQLVTKGEKASAGSEPDLLPAAERAHREGAAGRGADYPHVGQRDRQDLCPL